MHHFFCEKDSQKLCATSVDNFTEKNSKVNTRPKGDIWHNLVILTVCKGLISLFTVHLGNK
jgi:hypothetical protein